MQITELSFKKLYGYMDKKIEINNNISILVGINGSGKTSVLNLINWLLKPSFQDLCTIEFEKIILKFSYKADNYVLTCSQNKVETLINIKNTTKDITYKKVQATFKIHPNKLTKDENLKESIIDAYTNLSPEPSEIETWSFLFNELPKPTVIGLDRHIYTEEGEEIRYQSDPFLQMEKRKLSRRSNIKISPLDKVKSLLNTEHNIYRNRILLLHSYLNEKIMLSAFDNAFTEQNIEHILSGARPSISTIDMLKTQVISFLQETHGINYSRRPKQTPNSSIKKVDNYFNNLKNIIKNTKDKFDLLYITNINQFKKINDLIIEFSQFEEDKKALYHSLQEFLDTINKFLSDSSKQLYFDKEKSEIKFSINNKEGIKIDEGRDINNLSSGEKQILILLTYIKYHANQSIFILDEPELSLHPKWQAEFLDAIEKLMPKDSQLIIATHSPEVIGGREDSCTVLLPYNN